MLIWQQKRVSKRLVLSPPERQRLRERVRSRSARAEEVQRAKIILLIARGRSQWAVSRQLGCSINTVRLWLKRFMDERLAGLFSRHRGKIGQPTDCQAGSSDFGCGPTETQGWLDALEYSEVGGRTWHQPYASSPCSGQSRTAAPPPSPLHGQRRPGF